LDTDRLHACTIYNPLPSLRPEPPCAAVETKWTQEKLAERLKISWRYYQSLEAGSRAPSFELLLRIGKVLGCDWNDLMQDTEK